MSSFTQSSHLPLGLPLFLFPTCIPFIRLPTYSSSLLTTCPSHCNLVFCIFSVMYPTFKILLISSFLILSFPVIPSYHLNIFISASIFLSSAFVKAHVSIPYIIAGRTIFLYNCPFTVPATFLSHITPVILFHASQPACIRFAVPLSIPPSACIVDPSA